MKRFKVTIIIVSVLLLVSLAVFLLVYNQDSFAGERVKNPDAYALDIQRMNGSDTHTLELTAGDVLQIKFATVAGRLHMEIAAPDGALLYAGNGEEATAFELNISQTGAYSIAVTARHATGSISVRLKESAK